MLLTIASISLLKVSQQADQFVISRLETVSPNVALSRFVNYPSGAPKDRFTFNTNFWARGVDFSCVSPWNSGGGNLRAGTLISKRHLVCAKHFPLWKNVRIVFVGEDGGVCPCYIEATKIIPKTDIMVCSLKHEVTPNIHPAKILPPNADQYIGTGEGLPIVSFNQKEELFVNVMTAMPTNSVPYKTMRGHRPDNQLMAQFRDEIVTGDSGNPTFLIIGNEPVLLYCLLGPKGGCGFALHLYSKEIQKAMNELCPGYSLEYFDFGKM